jgi:hypothetical protein
MIPLSLSCLLAARDSPLLAITFEPRSSRFRFVAEISCVYLTHMV